MVVVACALLASTPIVSISNENNTVPKKLGRGIPGALQQHLKGAAGPGPSGVQAEAGIHENRLSVDVGIGALSGLAVRSRRTGGKHQLLNEEKY